MLKIIPLGGIGEIGLNHTIFETEKDIVIVDAGITFPSCSGFGVEVLIPDFSYLSDKIDKIKGILLTHGHDDHIGALPFLLKFLGKDIDIYGSDFTIDLVKTRFPDSFIDYEGKLVSVKNRERYKLGDFAAEFIPVTHSIIGSRSIVINVEDKTIIHSGDFKIDNSPIGDSYFDYERFTEYGESGVDILMLESTNVEVEGFSVSESEIYKNLESLFMKSPGRVILTTFSSHLDRIKQVLRISHKLGRKVVVEGRRLEETIRLGVLKGLISEEEQSVLYNGKVGKIPDEKLSMIVTGSQGEPFSALVRIAKNEHRTIKVKENDTFIISSKIIPGQEKAIYGFVNKLYENGVNEVYLGDEHSIHASGHAFKEELKIMMKLTRPKSFIPIHGEYRHLVKNGRLAKEMGIEDVYILKRGEGMIFENDDISKFDFDTGLIFVDGNITGDYFGEIIRKRKFASREGVLAVFLLINEYGDLVLEPEFFHLGILEDDEANSVSSVLKEIIVSVFDEIKEFNNDRLLQIAEEVRVAIRRYFKHHYGKKPFVEVKLRFFDNNKQKQGVSYD